MYGYDQGTNLSRITSTVDGTKVENDSVNKNLYWNYSQAITHLPSQS